MTTPTNLPRLAVFIDAENVGNPSFVDLVFDKIASAGLGTPAVKRVYGNPDLLRSKKWVAACGKHGIESVPQKHFVKGKNSADLKLVVEAMQIWYESEKTGEPIKVFCIVSSDTDFRPLVDFVADGKGTIYGFGKDETAEDLKKVFGVGFFSFENMSREKVIRDAAANILENVETHFLGYAALSGKLRQRFGKKVIPKEFSPKAVLRTDRRFDVEQSGNVAFLRVPLTRALRYLDNLEKSSKPRKDARLRASVSNFFLNRLTETELDAILSELEKAGVHSVGGRIVYPGETKRND